MSLQSLIHSTVQISVSGGKSIVELTAIKDQVRVYSSTYINKPTAHVKWSHLQLPCQPVPLLDIGLPVQRINIRCSVSWQVVEICY